MGLCSWEQTFVLWDFLFQKLETLHLFSSVLKRKNFVMMEVEEKKSIVSFELKLVGRFLNL